jgi:hypothetical protein
MTRGEAALSPSFVRRGALRFGECSHPRQIRPAARKRPGCAAVLALRRSPRARGTPGRQTPRSPAHVFEGTSAQASFTTVRRKPRRSARGVLGLAPCGPRWTDPFRLLPLRGCGAYPPMAGRGLYVPGSRRRPQTKAAERPKVDATAGAPGPHDLGPPGRRPRQRTRRPATAPRPARVTLANAPRMGRDVWEYGPKSGRK